MIVHRSLQEFKQSMIEVVELSSREIGEVENRVRHPDDRGLHPRVPHARCTSTNLIDKEKESWQVLHTLLENRHAESPLLFFQVARVENEIPAAGKGGEHDSVGVEELSRVLRLVETMKSKP